MPNTRSQLGDYLSYLMSNQRSNRLVEERDESTANSHSMDATGLNERSEGLGHRVEVVCLADVSLQFGVCKIAHEPA